MIKLTHPLPKKYWIACSGGIDSMSVLHWLHYNKPSRKDSLLGLIHIHHHQTNVFASKAFQLVSSQADWYGVSMRLHQVEGECPKGMSQEMWWRDKRYEFFKRYKEPIILAHNFDDCLEEYVMNTMVRGFQDVIPYAHANCVRPFRLWKRKDIENYVGWHGIDWVEDPSNADTKYKRNYIRHNIIPHILNINPGVYNIVERLVK